jgi:hypothetical protein
MKPTRVTYMNLRTVGDEEGDATPSCLRPSRPLHNLSQPSILRAESGNFRLLSEIFGESPMKHEKWNLSSPS